MFAGYKTDGGASGFQTTARKSIARLSVALGLLQSKKVTKTVYFRDGKRKIDAILVYNNKIQSQERDTFIKNLKKNSLELEEEVSMHEPSRTFVKVHGNEQLLQHHANLLGIPVKHDTLTVIAEDRVPCRFLKNILNQRHPNPEDPVAKRAWPTISKEHPTKLTFCERSAILFVMMDYIHFGKESEDFAVGLRYLMMKGGFYAAYPIHDGEWQWPDNTSAPLNDRQLLARYWANYDQVIKQQPLTTVENYFGPEVAMYFAWLSYYNRMLFFAAIMGTLTYMYGIFNLFINGSEAIDEVCASDLHICPVCKKCDSKLLNFHCLNYYLDYIHDHGLIILFACAMAFWAQAFMEFWKRRESILTIKWNLNTAIDDQLRPEFQAIAKCTRKHEYTGEMEQYIPLKTKFYHYTVSITVVFFMILTVLATILVIIIMECLLKMQGIQKVFITLISSFITLFVMMALKTVYASIAANLTSAENPRTLAEFDKSYMIKMVVFQMVNSYGKLVYIAFFRGKFFSYPGDERMRISYFPLAAEVCGPAGCVYDVAILLAVIMIFKPIMNNLWEIMVPKLEIWYKRCKKKVRMPPTDEMHIWEQDFFLIDDYSCSSEFEEMVMQYGYVTLLVAAFPMAPLCALINNIFEVRIDATKLLRFHRRPYKIYKQTISIWFDTLQSLTFIAIITNALYLSFTTNFITSVIYYTYYDKSFKGFYFFLLSKYKVEDNYWINANLTECYYVSQRYPPEEPNRYTFTYLHYYILSCQLSFVIIFVVIILFITAIIAYAIPDIPAGIKDLIAYNARKERSKLHGS